MSNPLTKLRRSRPSDSPAGGTSRVRFAVLIGAAVGALAGGLAVGQAHLPGLGGADLSSSKAKTSKTKIVKGPRGKRGLKGPHGNRGFTGNQGPQGLEGPRGANGLNGTDTAQSLAVNWEDSGSSDGHDTDSVSIPGIGTLDLVCKSGASQQQLVLRPSGGGRTVLNTSDFQSSTSSNNRSTSTGADITYDLPNNGMVNATVSVEPTSGDGGSGPNPASLTLSSFWKVNDPTPSENYCHVSGALYEGD